MNLTTTTIEGYSDYGDFVLQDANEEDPWGTFPLEPGNYNLRIYFRSEDNGASEELEGLLEYQIYIWSGAPRGHNVIR